MPTPVPEMNVEVAGNPVPLAGAVPPFVPVGPNGIEELLKGYGAVWLSETV